MLNQSLDLMRPLLVVIYLRMSSKMQNERSPDQQHDEILARINRRGYPWKIVRVYRDDAKSGRQIRNRPDYKQMMRDIASGAVVTDLIVVDTAERFGRVDEMSSIRATLRDKYGVLVLTADSDFADPSTPGGRALGMVETMRSTEHSRVLAHNVVRGKKDAIRQKHWPGGKPPLGYALESVMRLDGGRQVLDYSVLVPDVTTQSFVRALFEKAAETGWGGTKLAEFFNSQDDTPKELSPLSPSTIMYCLKNEIYTGTYVWNKNSTGIVADVRVVQPNAEDEVLRVENYCEPLITRDLWDQVLRLREVRSERASEAYTARTSTDKQLQILAPGMTINYLLSGLVFCSECSCRMRAMSTGAYMNKSGETKHYTKYMCSRFASGQCSNGVKVPEEWLRKEVLERILQRVLPGLDETA